MNKVFVERLPVYHNFPYMMLGNFAYTSKTDRYILNDYAISHDGEIETPAHHFSKIVSTVSFPKRSNHGVLSYPYRALPGLYSDAVYLDISKAYYQIARIFGLDCSFREGKYFAFGTTIPDTLFREDKMMRALLVSGTYPTIKLTEWKNNAINTRQFSNRNNAPYLRYAIFATLHAIQASLSRYTVYSHTDGFIVPAWYVRKVEQWLTERGIHYTCKGEGITIVRGVGSYTIGNRSSGAIGHRPKSSDNLRTEYIQWWLRNFDRGRNLRGDENSE